MVDECHTYRGVFGSHVAQVLRRLRRVCARYGADPVFVLASATVGRPGHLRRPADRAAGRRGHRRRLAARRSAFALWEPPLTGLRGEHGAPVRRTATAEAARTARRPGRQGVRTLAFVRSRRGAEVRRAHRPASAWPRSTPELAGRVAAYRGGLPARGAPGPGAPRSRPGRCSASPPPTPWNSASTSPAWTRSCSPASPAPWRRCGSRPAGPGATGRARSRSWSARDDPLDTYLVHHPEAIFGRPVEATVLDPDNPYVLGPHLCCAAAELPLTEDDLALFGARGRRAVLPELVRRGLLRRRPTGWYWTGAERAADLRHPRRRRRAGPGRRGGHRPAARHGRRVGGAHHRPRGRGLPAPGRTYLVDELDLDDSVALVDARRPGLVHRRPATPPTSRVVATTARAGPRRACDALRLGRGHQPGGVLPAPAASDRRGARRDPARPAGATLRTRAVWWNVTDAADRRGRIDSGGRARRRCTPPSTPRSACCRCSPPATAGTSAGSPQRCTPTPVCRPSSSTTAIPAAPGSPNAAYDTAARLAARDPRGDRRLRVRGRLPVLRPVPKCGNGNEPLDKAGAVRLLDAVLGALRC